MIHIQNTTAKQLSNTPNSFGCDDCFVVACTDKKYVFNLAEVVRLEASSNYTLIHCTNRRPVVVAKVLAAYEELLTGKGFIRVHRSHLVNSQHVHLIRKKDIVLHEGFKVDVSKRKRKAVLQQLRSEGYA